MKRKIRLWAVLGAVLGSLLMISPAARAQAQAAPRADDQMKKLKQELGLTEQQSSQLQALASSGQQQGAILQQKISAARRNLMAAVLGGADQATVQARVDELKRLTNEMIDLNTREIAKLAKILTPEQREKLLGAPAAPSQ